jgi:hypothetical protein
MTEEQLRAFPAFKTLPVYDESDERADAITSGAGIGQKIRECLTMAEVEECLKNPKLVPLGGLRAGPDGRKTVVVYFGELV